MPNDYSINNPMTWSLSKPVQFLINYMCDFSDLKFSYVLLSHINYQNDF